MDSDDIFGDSKQTSDNVQTEKTRKNSSLSSPAAIVPIVGDGGFDEGVLSGERDLVVRVGDSEKHGEGTVDSYVSYEITTITRLTTFSSNQVKVKRRYQDFIWLHDVLVRENKSSFIPPLPEKNRVEYLDRFSTEFIEKRRIALQRFIDRVTCHPSLKNSETLRIFLEAKSQVFETTKEVKKPQADISDAIMNAFSKVKVQDPRFATLSEYTMKFEDILVTLEKVVLRLAKRIEDLCEDQTDFSGVLNMMEEEEIVGELFHKLAQTTDRTTLSFKEQSEKLVHEFLSQLRDFYLYCQSIKIVLKERDIKVATYEEFVEILQQKKAEAAAPEGTKKWMNIKVTNLPETVPELEEIVKEAQEKSDLFSEEVIKEMDQFNQMKFRDIKDIMKNFANSQAQFHEASLKHWEQLLLAAESVQT